MELLRRIKNVINENYTWIRAVDDGTWRVMYIAVGNSIKPVACKNLVLECIKRNDSFPYGTKWFLPDFELKAAAKEVLGENLDRIISRREVENIVLIASDYTIQLRLRDYVMTEDN